MSEPLFISDVKHETKWVRFSIGFEDEIYISGPLKGQWTGWRRDFGHEWPQWNIFLGVKIMCYGSQPMHHQNLDSNNKKNCTIPPRLKKIFKRIFSSN